MPPAGPDDAPRPPRRGTLPSLRPAGSPGRGMSRARALAPVRDPPAQARDRLAGESVRGTQRHGVGVARGRTASTVAGEAAAGVLSEVWGVAVRASSASEGLDGGGAGVLRDSEGLWEAGGEGGEAVLFHELAEEAGSVWEAWRVVMGGVWIRCKSCVMYRQCVRPRVVMFRCRMRCSLGIRVVSCTGHSEAKSCHIWV